MRYWETYGSNVRDGKTYFKVYAPSALDVSMNDREMVKADDGSWNLTVDIDLTGLRYSYFITQKDGQIVQKADPVSKSNEVHPDRSSIVYSSKHSWSDYRWLSVRGNALWETSPMAIYEIHANSWIKGLSYRQLAEQLPGYLKKLGFNYVQFMPIADYPFTPSWGYQITGFYTPSAFFGEPDDFKYLVDALHQNNIGVILDWVGYHFPKDDFALVNFDGTNLYETEDNPDTTDWGTCLFDYSKPNVKEFMLSNLRYWVEEFHIDGFRVDAVAQMTDKALRSLPADWDGPPPPANLDEPAISFIKELNEVLRDEYPGVFTIAEDSGTLPNLTNQEGLEFSLKFHMHASWEWILHYLQPGHPVNEQNYLRVFSLIKNSQHEKHVWEISHDVVHHACNNSIIKSLQITEEHAVKALTAYLMMLISAPGKVMMFMGTELMTPLPWDAEGELDWRSKNGEEASEKLAKMLEIYRTSPELYAEDYIEGGFETLQTDENNGVFGFYRKANNNNILCLYNFSNKNQEIEVPSGYGVLLSSSEQCAVDYSRKVVQLPAYSGIWLRPTK
jgi:1,4-alpha-glucan branching enzyme